MNKLIKTIILPILTLSLTSCAFFEFAENEKYNIDFVGAYNSRFDYRAFDRTCSLYNKPNPLAKLDPVENDIMNFIGVITDTQDYKDFCEKTMI